MRLANRIVKGIEKFFPNLRVFYWDFGNLTTLTADDLKPFPELQALHVQYNKLVSLDGDLFKYTPKLRWIDFDKNLLENVGIGLLDGLNNLTSAWFINNPCIDMEAETPAAIQELKLKLQNQCPPLEISTTTSSTSTSLASTTTISATTESGQCSIECVELIENLQEENKRQDDKISAQADMMLRQNEKIAAQGDAIQELKKQMRELWARP